MNGLLLNAMPREGSKGIWMLPARWKIITLARYGIYIYIYILYNENQAIMHNLILGALQLSGDRTFSYGDETSCWC